MNTPAFSDLPSLENLKEDARALGREAADLAREKVLRPAQDLVRDSREQLGEAASRVSGQLGDASASAEELLLAQKDRASDWIKANPLTAVGLAVGAGLLLGALLRDRR